MSGLVWAVIAGSSVFVCVFVLTDGRASRPLPVLPGVRELLARVPAAGVIVDAKRRRGRNARCLEQMPVLLDVVTLGLSAGLSFDASLDLYCSRVDGELPGAVGQAMLSWQMGLSTRAEALSELADDLESTAFRRFADAVVEALAFGSPLAATLAGQSQAIRDEQRAQVEERIEKVPVKMLLPLGTLIVPAMLLAILGPLLSAAVGVI